METKHNMGDVTLIKKRARAIQTRFKELGVEIKLGHALEAQAVAQGYPNWATLSGMEATAPTSPTTTVAPALSFYDEVRNVARRMYEEKSKVKPCKHSGKLKTESPDLVFGLIVNEVNFMISKIADPFEVLDPYYVLKRNRNSANSHELARQFSSVLHSYAEHIANVAISEIITDNLPSNISNLIADVRRGLLKQCGKTIPEFYAEQAKEVIDQMEVVLNSMRDSSRHIDSTYLRLASELPEKLRRFVTSLITEMDHRRKPRLVDADWFDEVDYSTIVLVSALERFDKEAFNKIVCDAIKLD
jgi:hypothetical protein